MLNDLFKSAEERQKEQLEHHFNLGMQHLLDKFYNQAMIEFQKAMEINYEEVYPRLMLELDNAFRGGDGEAAMAIGLNVIKKDPSNYDMANKLGNYAREMGHYHQAENLYKMALKANKRYERAFYNLAACSARVELYDDGAKNSIDQFGEVYEYILPDYAAPLDMPQLLEELETKVEADREARLQEEQEELDRKRDLGDEMEAQLIEKKIKEIKDSPLEVSKESVYKSLDEMMEADPANLNSYLYNKGLYALHVKDAQMATECFEQLQDKDWDYLGLLKAIAVHYAGDLEEAIGMITRLLGKNEFNRYFNVNLGLMFRKAGKRFLSVKYLIKTAYLLEKSGGLYSMKELVKQADNLAETGKQKKALNFYMIATTEIPSAELWAKIGALSVEMKKYDEAVDAYRQVFKHDPKSDLAQENLEKIHAYYAEKGEALMKDRKFKASIEYYEKSLTVLRPIPTLQHAVSVYRELNQPDKAEQLQDEIIRIRAQDKARQDEEDRQNLIAQAKSFMQQKNYLKAIERLESAFRMAVDKNVFLQLAAIYKGLKKKRELDSLVDRWQKMLEHHEKMQKLQKEMDRQKSVD